MGGDISHSSRAVRNTKPRCKLHYNVSIDFELGAKFSAGRVKHYLPLTVVPLNIHPSSHTPWPSQALLLEYLIQPEALSAAQVLVRGGAVYPPLSFSCPRSSTWPLPEPIVLGLRAIRSVLGEDKGDPPTPCFLRLQVSWPNKHNHTKDIQARPGATRGRGGQKGWLGPKVIEHCLRGHGSHPWSLKGRATPNLSISRGQAGPPACPSWRGRCLLWSHMYTMPYPPWGLSCPLCTFSTGVTAYHR